MSDARLEPESHFESMEVQAHAAKLGMWIFLSSELLLFAGLFALYAASRAHAPEVFHEEVLQNAKAFGSTNTAILLTSSITAALGVHAIREGHRQRSMLLFSSTIVFALAFLGIKIAEYTKHIHDGIYPGGHGDYFTTHEANTHAPFWTLYYVMTGLHAVHVLVGIGVLASVIWGIRNQAVFAGKSQRAEIGAMYWHLIDLVWIFLWPLFYLA